MFLDMDIHILYDFDKGNGSLIIDRDFPHPNGRVTRSYFGVRVKRGTKPKMSTAP